MECENRVYECKLRGILKKQNKKTNCIVGDLVEFSNKDIFITKILPRKNYLKRPLVANIDYIFITLAAKEPNFDINTLNLLLLNASYYNIKPIVIINKIDLLDEIELNTLKEDLDFLEKIDIKYIFASVDKNKNIKNIKELIGTSVVAFGGPSGVGKSSILNLIQSGEVLEIGEVSKKHKRGRHTTKGTTLLKLDTNGYVIDTPGFTSLEIPKINDFFELLSLFPEFESNSGSCKFNDCRHIYEPKCHIKQLVDENKISKKRYEFYKMLYLKLKEERWNKYD